MDFRNTFHLGDLLYVFRSNYYFRPCERRRGEKVCLPPENLFFVNTCQGKEFGRRFMADVFFNKVWPQFDEFFSTEGEGSFRFQISNLRLGWQ
jgi:hypothetical protein